MGVLFTLGMVLLIRVEFLWLFSQLVNRDLTNYEARKVLSLLFFVLVVRLSCNVGLVCQTEFLLCIIDILLILFYSIFLVLATILIFLRRLYLCQKIFMLGE
jgi:hypothetical protein